MRVREIPTKGAERKFYAVEESVDPGLLYGYVWWDQACSRYVFEAECPFVLDATALKVLSEFLSGLTESERDQAHAEGDVDA